MPQYRQERNYENLNRAMFAGVGAYDIPVLNPTYCDTENWLSFNYAKTCQDPEGHGIHFFIDDYQFNRLWADPERYVPMLSKFEALMTPDFSTYTDFPKAIQIYNHYRKHWLGAFWQLYGLTVIPTISWSDESSFEWCFDGEPVGGTVAVSAVGTQVDNKARGLFRAGWREMLARLEPESVIFYGAVPDECRNSGVKIMQVAAYQDKLKKFNKRKNTIDNGAF